MADDMWWMHDPRLEIAALRIKLLATVAGIGDLESTVLTGCKVLASSHPPQQQEPDVAEFWTLAIASTLDSAQAALIAASIIFMHAVCETVLMDLCKLTAALDPQAWYPRIRSKKVSVEDLERPTEIKKEVLEKYLSVLQKESMLKKADALMSVLQPQSTKEILPDFHYDPHRLEEVDEFRHKCAHDPNLVNPVLKLAELHEMVDYLRAVADMFIVLTMERYQIEDLAPSKDKSAI